MFYRTLIFSVLALTPVLHAEDRGELVFEDDFERSESQEKVDEPGNGWGTNSKSRAKGNKQVDLRDGAMYIYIHEEANHGVSVTQPFEFTDGAVEMRFMLEDEKDSLGLDFADLSDKSVWAGHLFVTKIRPEGLQIADLKSGTMDLKIRNARKEGTLTEAQKTAVKESQKNFPLSLEVGKWYDLLVEVEGDTVTVSIDGEEKGTFSAPGFAHPTKKLLRLAIPGDAVVDDVRFWKKK